MRFLSTQIPKTVVEDRGAYSLCRFERGRAPVLGVVLFRTKLLHELLESWGAGWRWSDVDFVVECADRGLEPFAYVPQAGIYHRSFVRPRVYLRKKQRDVRWSYLATLGARRASYLSWTSRRDLLRLTAWMLYVNTLLPPLAVAAARSLRYRDWALLYEAFMAIVGTDFVLGSFLADPRGRALARSALVSMMRRRGAGRAMGEAP